MASIPAEIKAEINRRFDYHAPDDEKRDRHERMREAFKQMAWVIVMDTPEGREQATALTHLETAMFWANAAIAREGR
jgi:hypothetical protein